MSDSDSSAGPISVLIVDDSALMRSLIGKIVDGEPDLQVAAKAMNGSFALQKIPNCKPDCIVLDLEMPEMNGIEFLQERRKRGIDIPVIILSSVAKKGASITMQALGLGAADFIMKPSGSVSEDIHTVAKQLTEMIRGFGRKYRAKHGMSTVAKKQADQETGASAAQASTAVAEEQAPPPTRPPKSGTGTAAVTAPPPRKIVPEAEPGAIEIIAIGISTGGPNALRKVFAELDGRLAAPIVVVQHMPAGFTEEFAKSLDRVCALEVKEAEEGDMVRAGRILIAPGNRHLRVQRRSLGATVHLSDEAPVNGHRPSCDVLFESVADAFGNKALAVIMTGMGKDGALKIGEVYRRGGITLGQDAGSSVVYGMPRVAFELGHLTRQISLPETASEIQRLVQESHS